MLFLWVFLYGAVYLAAGSCSDGMQWVRAGAMLLYNACFICWICLKKDRKRIGLSTEGAGTSFEKPAFWGAMILPVCNLLSADRYLPEASAVVLLLSASVTEELFFRGYLLEYLRRRGDTFAIVVASVLFALFHLVNWSAEPDVMYIVLQVLCAFFASVCYCVLVIRTGSILPAMGLHILTNYTGCGVLTKTGRLTAGCYSVGLSLCWSIWAIQRIRKKEM